MPRCYMVKKSSSREAMAPVPLPPLASPTEGSVAPSCYSPDHCALIEPSGTEFADGVGEAMATAQATQAPGTHRSEAAVFRPERSAADTEAAHDLLSLAQSLPPMPPATIVTVLQPSPLLLSYTLQPANIYILAEQPEMLHSAPDHHVVYDMHTPAPAPPPVSPVHHESRPPSPADSTYVIIRGHRHARYDCGECGKRYATSSNLSRHKQTHRSLDSMAAKRCGECGKAYVSMPALAMHVLTHRMGHACGVCGKQFSRPWLLRGHLRSHTGEKPYSCASCGKAFADRSNFRAHLQTHSADKKFRCGRCGKTFALKSYLNKHQEVACVRLADDACQ